jgi:hypothetical protein
VRHVVESMLDDIMVWQKLGHNTNPQERSTFRLDNTGRGGMASSNGFLLGPPFRRPQLCKALDVLVVAGASTISLSEQMPCERTHAHNAILVASPDAE